MSPGEPSRAFEVDTLSGQASGFSSPCAIRSLSSGAWSWSRDAGSPALRAGAPAAAAFASPTRRLSIALGAGVSDLAETADPPIDALPVGP